MSSNLLYDRLKQHVGHEVEIWNYGDGACMSLECVNCGCVIFDSDIYDLIGVCFGENKISNKEKEKREP